MSLQGFDEQIGIIAEATIGTTPPTPQFQLLPVASCTLSKSRELLESNRLGRAFRYGTRLGANNIGGDIAGELVYGAFDDLIAAAIGGTWQADTPATGTDQVKGSNGRAGFTVMRRRGSLGYQYFRGCEVSQMQLEIGQNASISSTFTMVGTEEVEGNSILSGQLANLPETDDLPLTGYDVAVQLDGANVGDATAMSLTTNRNINASFVLGSYNTGRKPSGKLIVEGSVTIQFTDFSWHQRFADETKVDMDLIITDPFTLNALTIRLPAVLATAKTDDTTSDQEVPLVVNFSAEYDSAEGTNIIFERTEV